MRCNSLRFVPPTNSSAVSPRRRWNCWHPPRRTNALTLRWHTCEAWPTCSLRKGAEAAAEFQKILDHKGASWGSTWRSPNWGQSYSLAWLGLARASVLAGDVANARKAFETFFTAWKDADPDIAILQQAKAEYGKLR